MGPSWEPGRVAGGGRHGQLPVMPTPPDPQQDADYRALVEALAREGLSRRTEAVRAVEAVACALAQRIGAPEFDRVRELLPDPFRGRLLACELHAPAPRAHFRGSEDFYELVAQDLDRDPEDVEPTVRAVFAALRAQLPDEQAEEVSGRLPAELEPLWRRPS
jgi:uncharacterized protein (DUF2267 family)